MKEIIWFCRTSDSSSLSRITDSLLPILSSKFDITLLSNKSELKSVKNVVIGSDSKSIRYNDYVSTYSKNDLKNVEKLRFINVKYITIQIVDLVYEGNYDYVVICNGVYEVDWFTKILTDNGGKFLINKNGKKTKLVVWAPIDYIPTYNVIKNTIKSDIFLTMTPVMRDILKNLNNGTASIDWLGHGSDIVKNGDNSIKNRSDLAKELNEMRKKRLIISKEEFKEDDIIILNANNYGPIKEDATSVQNTSGTRKRLDITLKAFLEVSKKRKDPRIKLWIHTNLKAFFDMLSIEQIMLATFADSIILSENKVTDDQLKMIYQFSDISIQTSYAEGWSLTNLEASLYDSLQVVPDFLATGYHYKDRGILIPVTKKIIKNEGGHDVVIGEVSIEDTVTALEKGLDTLENKEELDRLLKSSKEYAESYTWESIADKLENILSFK